MSNQGSSDNNNSSNAIVSSTRKKRMVINESLFLGIIEKLIGLELGEERERHFLDNASPSSDRKFACLSLSRHKIRMPLLLTAQNSYASPSHGIKFVCLSLSRHKIRMSLAFTEQYKDDKIKKKFLHRILMLICSL